LNKQQPKTKNEDNHLRILLRVGKVQVTVQVTVQATVAKMQATIN